MRCHRAIDPAAQQAIWHVREAALGLSMAMKGDAKALSFVEDAAVAPERLRDYIRDLLAIVAPARHRGRRLRARVRRLPARAAGRRPEDRRRASGRSSRSRRRSPTSCSSTAARCPASTATASSAARSWSACSAPSSTTRSGRSSARSIRTASSIPARSSTRRRSRANLRYGPAYRTAPVATLFDYDRARRLRRRRRDVQRPRRLPQGAAGHDVPVVHGDARGGALDARPRERAAAGAVRQARRGRAGRRRACARCSICASNAARARAECPVGVDVARMKSEFLAAYWQPPRHARCARARSATSIGWRVWGSRFAPRLERARAQRAGPRAERTAARPRSPAHAAGVGAADVRAGSCRGRRHPERPADASRSSSTRSPITFIRAIGMAGARRDASGSGTA